MKRSSVNGWAYLQSNLLRNVGGSAPASVSINEESGNLLRTRVDAVSGDEYVVVWINGEAIAGACEEVIEGELDDQFVVDIFQT